MKIFNKNYSSINKWQVMTKWASQCSLAMLSRSLHFLMTHASLSGYSEHKTDLGVRALSLKLSFGHIKLFWKRFQNILRDNGNTNFTLALWITKTGQSCSLFLCKVSLICKPMGLSAQPVSIPLQQLQFLTSSWFSFTSDFSTEQVYGKVIKKGLTKLFNSDMTRMTLRAAVMEVHYVFRVKKYLIYWSEWMEKCKMTLWWSDRDMTEPWWT